MQTLIIYDSAFGNTEQIAKAIARGLGESREVQIWRVGGIKPSGLAGAKLVIIGSPTQGGRPTPAIMEFLDSIPKKSLKGVLVASFDTRISLSDRGKVVQSLVNMLGYAAGRIARKLRKAGGTAVAPAEGFVVTGREGPLGEGELERAAGWAKKLATLV